MAFKKKVKLKYGEWAVPAGGQTVPNPLPLQPWRLSALLSCPRRGTEPGSGEELFPHPFSPPMTNALQFGHLHRAGGPQSELSHTGVSVLILNQEPSNIALYELVKSTQSTKHLLCSSSC